MASEKPSTSRQRRSQRVSAKSSDSLLEEEQGLRMAPLSSRSCADTLEPPAKIVIGNNGRAAVGPGETCCLNMIHREVLDLHRNLLHENLNPWSVSKELYAAEVMSAFQCRQMRKVAEDGNLEVNKLLVAFIWRMGTVGFIELVSALNRLNQNGLASILMKTEKKVRDYFFRVRGIKEKPSELAVHEYSSPPRQSPQSRRQSCPPEFMRHYEQIYTYCPTSEEHPDHPSQPQSRRPSSQPQTQLSEHPDHPSQPQSRRPSSQPQTQLSEHPDHPSQPQSRRPSSQPQTQLSEASIEQEPPITKSTELPEEPQETPVERYSWATNSPAPSEDYPVSSSLAPSEGCQENPMGRDLWVTNSLAPSEEHREAPADRDPWASNSIAPSEEHLESPKERDPWVSNSLAPSEEHLDQSP